MSAYHRIEMALKSIRLDDQYLGKFVDNKIDDDLLQECLNDSQQLFNLSEIVPVVGDRVRFSKAFNSIDMSSSTGTGSSTTPLINATDGLQAKRSHPVQIMDFGGPNENNGHSEVIFHQKVFEQVLMKTKTDKVAFISIAGPSRKGKSFFLNLVLQYLNDRTNNKTNWVLSDDLDERLDGFTWRTSTDRVTKGIWLWSEPLQIKSTNGGDDDEFDLLIMDTQGVFDEYTTMREWSILVGLALLASSCLVFNVVGDVQEDALLIFEKFLDFGLMALNEDNKTTPFQNLLFLVRDWHVPAEYPYGFTGGRKYLQSKLDTKSIHKESHIKIRQQLKNCFEEISCCLLPHPGDEFLLNGRVGRKDDPFGTEIQKCISEMMDPVNIPLKKINGNRVLKADIIQAFINYCDFFNSDDTLKPESIFQVISKQSNELVIRNCVEHFKNKVNSQLATRPFFLRSDLFDIRETVVQECLDIFDQSRIMGDRSLLKVELSRQLQESYKAIAGQNADNRRIVVLEAFDKASKEFVDIVSNGMKDSYLSNNALDNLLSESERKVCATFSSHCGVTNIEMIPVEATKLHEFIRSKSNELKSDNALEKKREKKIVNDTIQKLVDVYAKNMEDRTHGRVVSETQIEELHDIMRKQSFDQFNALQMNQQFVCEAERNLKTKIAESFERIYKNILRINAEIDSDGNALVARAVSNFQNSAKVNITANRVHFERLQEDLFKSAQRTVIDDCPINDSEFLGKLLTKLGNECAKYKLAMRHTFERIQREIATELHKGRDEAIDLYKRSLTTMLPQNGPVDSKTLHDAHAQILQLSTEWLECVFRQVCKTYKGVDENSFTNFKVDVNQRIESEFDSVKQMNAQKIRNAMVKSVELFDNAKKSYASRMKEALQNLPKNEENLRFIQSGIKKDLSQSLQLQLKDLYLSQEQQANYLKDFHSNIDGEFEVTLEVCRMRMVEDELTVRAAFLDAREFYKDEIDKHLQSKDWFEVSELDQLHEMIVEAAIVKSRDEVDITDSQEGQLRELFRNLFKKYQDRNWLRMPMDDCAIGIDLGTTYSCVAVCIRGKVTVIAQNEKTTIPSYVAFNDNSNVDVGEAAKEQSFRRPECTIFDAKRLIGRKFSDNIVQDDIKLWPFEVVDSSDQPKIKVPGHSETYFPEQISARVLAHLKKMAEDFLNKKVKNAVVTVPAYFSESQRHATKDAAQIAGLEAKILNEPTAAAISYELHRSDDFARNVFIFDLGGGTFDVAVLKMNGGEVTVKAIGGDTHLGGEDFDNEMVKHIIKLVNEKHNIDLGRNTDSSDPALRRDASVRLRRIRSACEKQKRLLSMTDSVNITIEKIDGNFDLDETFTRAQFEALNMSKFKNCIDITAAVISDAGMVKSEIDDVVLVGGSTRIPKIRELLTQFFDGKALNKQMNADEAVAYGAAIQASLVFGKRYQIKKNVKVNDVTPMSLGLRTADGSMSRIIRKNTPIPCSQDEQYITARDGQTAADIDIYEGEKLNAVDNNKLGTFRLCGIPEARAGEEPIDVTMTIDSEGLLHVKAICRSTGKSEGITIEQHKGRMSLKEIEIAKLDMN